MNAFLPLARSLLGKSEQNVHILFSPWLLVD
jgi:hypothetical protein